MRLLRLAARGVTLSQGCIGLYSCRGVSPTARITGVSPSLSGPVRRPFCGARRLRPRRRQRKRR